MHFIILLLVISFLGFPVLASTYKVGDQICDKVRAESVFNEYPELASSREGMARCFIIEGLAENQSWLVTQGLNEMVRQSENQGRISASYFLAQYYFTGKVFDGYSNRFLEEAEKYFLLTLSQIEDLGSDYPGAVYDDMEEAEQVELNSYYRLPMLFLMKYTLGIQGANSQKLLDSPIYRGTRNLETYPKYSLNDKSEYLDKALFHANKCISSLEKQSHKQFPKYQQACQSIHKVVQSLKKLEPQRHYSLQRCIILSYESNTCPNYNLVMWRIGKLRMQLQEELDMTFTLSSIGPNLDNQKKNGDDSCVSHKFEIELWSSPETLEEKDSDPLASKARGTFTNNCSKDALILWQSNGENELLNLNGNSCNMRTGYHELFIDVGDTREYLVWLPLNCSFEIEWCDDFIDDEDGDCY